MKALNKLVAVAALALIATPAIAQETAAGKQMYVGGLAGLAMSMAEGAESQFTYGAEFGYKLDSTMAVGLYFTTFSTSVTVLGTEFSTSASLLQAFFDYYVMPELHVGVLAGLSMVSSDPGDSASDLAFGARAGYEFNVADGLTFGPEVNAGISTAEGSELGINLLGAIKYHF